MPTHQKKKKTRTPVKKKPDDPVQDCPLKKKPEPTYCYLTAIEIAKGEKPKRTRWGKDASKFVVFPVTVRDKEESNTSSGFPVFSPAKIHIVAVRPNLVDKDNKAMTIKAELKDPKTATKPDDDHEADEHLALDIDRKDDSTLRRAAQGAIDTLVAVFDAEKKIKDAWKDIEKRRKKLEDGISKIDSDPKAAQKSIDEALKVGDDDEDDEDDEEAGDEEDDDNEDDEDKDGMDDEDTPSKLKAEVYPQDPTISKIFEKAPVALAKWCPEKYNWARKLPAITDVLRALWLKDFSPRVYSITATSCGEVPDDKAAEAARSLKAEILVYPADQFKFILRVPKLAKGSVGYEGRYISKTGEFKSVKTAAFEIKGVEDAKDEEDESAKAGEDESPKEKEDPEDGPDLYDPDSYKEDDNDEEDKDDDEDDEEETTLLEISEDKWVLPWDDNEDDDKDDADSKSDAKEAADDNKGDGADKDVDGEEGGKKEDDKKDSGDDKKEDKKDDEEDGEIKKFELKLTRVAQPPEKEEADKKDGDDKDEGDEDKELDYSESLSAIFNVIQSLREVWDHTKGLSFTLGFSIEASIGFLEGRADWEWGWRESTRLTEAPTEYLSGLKVAQPDRQMPLVVYSQKYSAKLTILSLELALKLGIDLTYAGIGFRAALVGKIEGKLEYESESVQEYCPQMKDYFKSDPEKWVVSTIEGTLTAKAILLSADTFRATSEIKTGYWVRAKRGDDESFQIAYEWRFLGLKMKSEFKIKGYKNVETDDVVLLAETPEATPHAGTFPTYASRTPYSFRQTLMEYKAQCWDVQQDMQRKMTHLRVLYFSKFFPKLWPKIQAAKNVKKKPMIWGTYDEFDMSAWINQIRRIAKTAPDGQIALGIQHTVYRNVFVSRSGFASWATRSGIWDEELDGMLVPDNTDLDIMGEDMGEFLWNLRILGAFYIRFVVFCEMLHSYCDKAIAMSRAEENLDANAPPSEDFKEKFLHVGRAFRDIMYGPEKDGKKIKNQSGWKDGKFKKYYEAVREQINGFDMASIVANQLVDGYDNARVRNGRIKFNYPLSTTHGGHWTNDELSNANIRWQKRN